MRILTLGIDETTLALIKRSGIAADTLDQDDISIVTPDDLCEWLKLDPYETAAIVVNLDATGLGIYLPRSIRAKNFELGVIGICSRSDTQSWSQQRSLFLESGGDDLLAHPANPRELIATLQAVIRRLRGSVVNVVTLDNGRSTLRIDLTLYRVWLDNRRIGLSRREMSILFCLAERGIGKIVSKDGFLNAIYGGMEEPESKTIDVIICRLRDKFERINPFSRHFIQTVWGVGFRLSDELPEGALTESGVSV